MSLHEGHERNLGLHKLPLHQSRNLWLEACDLILCGHLIFYVIISNQSINVSAGSDTWESLFVRRDPLQTVWNAVQLINPFALLCHTIDTAATQKSRPWHPPQLNNHCKTGSGEKLCVWVCCWCRQEWNFWLQRWWPQDGICSLLHPPLHPKCCCTEKSCDR